MGRLHACPLLAAWEVATRHSITTPVFWIAKGEGMGCPRTQQRTATKPGRVPLSENQEEDAADGEKLAVTSA